MLQILPITLPQAKADNTPKELLNKFFFVSNQRKLQKKKKNKIDIMLPRCFNNENKNKTKKKGRKRQK